MFNFIKDVIQWLSKRENRNVAFKYYRTAMSIVRYAAKFTNTVKDDEGLEFIAKKIASATYYMPEAVKKQFIKTIDTAKKGSLKHVNAEIDIADNKFKIGLGPVGIQYDLDTLLNTLLKTKFNVGVFDIKL